MFKDLELDTAKKLLRLRENNEIYWDSDINCWIISRYDDIIHVLLNEDIYSIAMGDLEDGIKDIEKNYINNNYDAIMFDYNYMKNFNKFIHQYFSQINNNKTLLFLKTNIKNSFVYNKNINITKNINLLIAINILNYYFDFNLNISNIYKNIILNIDSINNIYEIKKELEDITNKNIKDTFIYKQMHEYFDSNDLAAMSKYNLYLNNFISSTMLNALVSIVGSQNIILYSMYENKFNISEDNYKLFIKESIRFYSINAKFARKVVLESKIKNTNFDVGDTVILLTGSANRDIKYFGNDSDMFNIYRNFKKITLEFGFGQHLCLAYKLIQSHIEEYTKFLLNKNIEISNIDFDKDFQILGSPIKEIYGVVTHSKNK